MKYEEFVSPLCRFNKAQPVLVGVSARGADDIVNIVLLHDINWYHTEFAKLVLYVCHQLKSFRQKCKVHVHKTGTNFLLMTLGFEQHPFWKTFRLI